MVGGGGGEGGDCTYVTFLLSSSSVTSGRSRIIRHFNPFKPSTFLFYTSAQQQQRQSKETSSTLLFLSPSHCLCLCLSFSFHFFLFFSSPHFSFFFSSIFHFFFFFSRIAANRQISVGSRRISLIESLFDDTLFVSLSCGCFSDVTFPFPNSGTDTLNDQPSASFDFIKINFNPRPAWACCKITFPSWTQIAPKFR